MSENKSKDQALAKPLPKLRDELEKQKGSFQSVANRQMSVDRLIKLTLAAAGKNPKILECSISSVLQFCMRCAETGLEPIGAGGAWPIPYENKKAGTVELTFVTDYRGMINAAKHANCIVDAFAELVREEDKFEYQFGLNPDLKHIPEKGDRGELTHAYCIFELPSGKQRFIVMDRAEIEAIRDRTPAWRAFKKYGKECPWNTDEGEQWKKTAVRRGMKPFAGATREMTALIEYDNESTGIDFKDVSAFEPVEMPKLKEKPSERASGGKKGSSEESSEEVSDDFMTKLNTLEKYRKPLSKKLDKATLSQFEEWYAKAPEVEEGDVEYWIAVFEKNRRTRMPYGASTNDKRSDTLNSC